MAPLLVGIENAILDLNADVSDAFLQQHGIAEDSATFVDAAAYAALRHAVAELPTAKFMAGGLTQNALRVAARLAPHASFVAFVGFALGGDRAFAPRLCAELARDHVRARFAVDADSTTTVVTSLVPPSRRRSLAFSSAAPSAEFTARFAASFLEHDAASRALLERAAIAYSAGWMLLVSPQLIVNAAACLPRDSLFAFNLAAEAIVRAPHLALLLQVLPHTDVLFGNDHEFRALAISLGWHTDASLANPLTDSEALAIATAAAALLRPRARRIVAMTRSALPTAVFSDATGGAAALFDVLPVTAVVDTTGAGDAFVGGFLCALAQKRTLADCVGLGHFAARLIVGVQGCDVGVIRGPPAWFQQTTVPCVYRGQERAVVPFYWPGRSDVWHDRLGSGCLGNFWIGAESITVRVGGRSGTFRTSEAAYQAMKWWFDDDVRAQFERVSDGDAAFALKLALEAQRGVLTAAWKRADALPLALLSDEELRRLADDEAVAAQQLTSWRAMELVLAAKFAHAPLRSQLLATRDAFLLEHNPVRGRDLIWSDNRVGDGANRLGHMLMLFRERWQPGTWPSYAVDWTEFQTLACDACSEVEAFWRGYDIVDTHMDDGDEPASQAGAVAAARQVAAVVAIDRAALAAVATGDDDVLEQSGVSVSGLSRHEPVWRVVVGRDAFARCIAALPASASRQLAGTAMRAACAAQQRGVSAAALGFALGDDVAEVVALTRGAQVRGRFVVEPATHTPVSIELALPSRKKLLRVVSSDDGAPTAAFSKRFARALLDNDTESDRLLVCARVLLTSAAFVASLPTSACVVGAAARFFGAGGGREFILALDCSHSVQIPRLACVFDTIQAATIVVCSDDVLATLAIESAWFEDLHVPLADDDVRAIVLRLAPRLRSGSRGAVVVLRAGERPIVSCVGGVVSTHAVAAGAMSLAEFTGRFAAQIATQASIETAIEKTKE